MTQNITDSIRSAVLKHYSETDEVLLLSELGNILRAEGSWPLADDQRSLAKIIEELAPEIILCRDPNILAYVAVVPAGKEQLVTDAIEKRRRTHLLSRLPRPFLLAFWQTTEVAIAAASLNRMLELGRPEYVRLT